MPTPFLDSVLCFRSKHILWRQERVLPDILDDSRDRKENGDHRQGNQSVYGPEEMSIVPCIKISADFHDDQRHDQQCQTKNDPIENPELFRCASYMQSAS